MGPRPPARAAAHAAARRPGDRGVQPRALHPRAHGDGSRRQAAGQRPGDGGRAGDARLLGHLDRARQRQRRPRGRRRARPRRACRPGTTTTRLRRIWLTRARRSRATTTASPTRACGRCATWPTCGRCSASRTGSSTATVNQRFADAVVAEARSEDPVVLVQDYHFALLPAMIARAAAARDDPHVLAHPLAQPRVVRHLPVAARDPARHAGQHDPRLPHPLPLQELHRDGRPLTSRRGSSTNTRSISFQDERDAGRELSDLDRVARRGRRSASWPPVERMPRARVRAPAACARHLRSRSASTASTTPRASSSGCTRSSGCSRSIPSGSASSCSCRSPRRRAARSRSTSSFQERIARRDRAHQRALRRRRLPAGAPAGRAPRARRASTSCSAPPTSAW